MMNPIRLFAPVFALFLVWVAPLSGQTEIVKATNPSGASIRLSSPYGELPEYGFLPVIAELQNPGTGKAVWDIEQRSYGQGSFQRNFRLECPPMESRGVNLLLAVGPIESESYYGGSNYLNITVRANGVGQSGNMGGSGHDSFSAQSILTGTKVSGGPPSGRRIAFDVSLAASDWRGYQGFAGVLINDGEWRGMSPGQKLALTTWAKSGGSLVVLTTEAGQTAATLGLPDNDPSDLKWSCGLGTIRVAQTNENLVQHDGNPPGFFRQHEDAFRRGNGGSGILEDWMNRNPLLAERKNGGFLTGLMLLVVAVFAVVIGPINLFVIAPAKRRHKLFFSVPIISAVAGAFLLLSVILSDGIGGKGARYLLVENRPCESENNNHLIQYQTSECGVLFTTGFESKGAVFVDRLSRNRRSGRDLSGSFELAINADGVDASGPWFASRTRQHYRVMGVNPSRGRVEISGVDASARLTSTFDFPLDTLYFSRDGQQWWKATGIQQGVPTAVAPVGKSELDTQLADALREAPREISDKVTQLRQRPMHFIALTGKPPAIATHTAIDWTDHGFITGPLVAP